VTDDDELAHAGRRTAPGFSLSTPGRLMPVAVETRLMPEIELSPEQHAYVEALREELADEVTYGTVRLQDAVQYLVDHHREDGDLDVEIDVDDAADTDTAADGGQAVQTEPADTDTATATDAQGDDEPGTGTEGDDADAVDTGPGGPLGAGNDKVSEMLNLLDDHEDVWREADGSEGRYAVDLPDGETEHVQTKDDVRALLFRHHR
jgi:hypothetical protein